MLTVTSKLLENLPSGGAKQTRGDWAGSRGGGTGSAGPDQRNHNNPRVWSQQNARGRARRAKGTAQPTASAPASSGRWPAAFRNLGPGASRKRGVSPPSLWKRPSWTEATRRSGQTPGAPRLPASQTHRPASVPRRPLTRMKAATTSVAAATRHFPAARTSTPGDSHQLGFQHKPGSSSSPAPPLPAPPRPAPAEVTRTRPASARPPGEERFRFARASASPSAAAPPPPGDMRSRAWLSARRRRASGRACGHAPASAWSGATRGRAREFVCFCFWADFPRQLTAASVPMSLRALAALCLDVGAGRWVADRPGGGEQQQPAPRTLSRHLTRAWPPDHTSPGDACHTLAH